MQFYLSMRALNARASAFDYAYVGEISSVLNVTELSAITAPLVPPRKYRTEMVSDPSVQYRKKLIREMSRERRKRVGCC